MNIRGRLAVTVAVLCAGLFFIAPALKKDLPEWWSQYQINLGLDLQGGMHLVLGVDQDEAVNGVMERLVDEVRDSLKEKHIRLKRISVSGLGSLKAGLMSERDKEETGRIIAEA